MVNPILKYTTAFLWVVGLSGTAVFLSASQSYAGEAFEDKPSTSADEAAVTSENDSTNVAPAAKSSGNADLTNMSLESLTGLNVVVTSSAKKAENLRDTTSAIFVITSDDIRRSGAQHLADLLAMVPGIQVARQSSNEWAISARGFNASYNNKMLVLIDGRSVYDPILGGVTWNEQDIPLEDIDHIEVIRGPGGTLWGVNAVNGIVNVITKDAKLTQGLYVSGAGGAMIYDAGISSATVMNGLGAARYGGKLGDDLYYRVYGQTTNHQPDENPLGGAAHDGWYDFRGGFRADWHADQDQLTLEGGAQKGYFDYFRGDPPGVAQPSYFNPLTFQFFKDANTTVDQNAHLVGRWTRSFKDDSEIQVLSYYDYVNKTTANDSRITNIGTADIEAQHRFKLGSWNEITYGGSFRNSSSHFYNPINFVYTPADQNVNIYGGVVQDRLTLAEERLYLTAGAKLENNPYTGDEFQPSARLLWTPDSKNSVWAAVSRAVRIPQQLSETADIFLFGIPANAYGPGFPASNLYAILINNPKLISETLVSYELGYRTNPTKDTSLDLAAFCNHYEHLFTFVNVANYSVFAPGPSTPIGGNELAAYQELNGGVGNIYGVEVSAKWDPSANFHLALAYTYQSYDQNMINAGNLNLGAVPPHILINARLTYEPVRGWELNGNTYYSDWTPQYDPTQPGSANAYTRVDVGTTWKATDNLEASLWALDLEGSHSESFKGFGTLPVNIAPSAYGQVTVRY